MNEHECVSAYLFASACVHGVRHVILKFPEQNFKKWIRHLRNQELMSGAKRREGAFNCACRAVTASSKVIRHSMSI